MNILSMSSWCYREPEYFNSPREIRDYLGHCRSELKDLDRQLRILERQKKRLDKNRLLAAKRGDCQRRTMTRFARRRRVLVAISRCENAVE